MTAVEWRAWVRRLVLELRGSAALRRFRPCLEPLEDRCAPAVLTVNSLLDTIDPNVLTLRAAILVENGSIQPAAGWSSQINGTPNSGGGDTITFDPKLAGQTITLTAFDDSSFGPAAFLVNSQVSIVGDSLHGITIARSSSAADFRLFTVAASGDLTLQNITLSGGLAQGGAGGGYVSEGGGGGGAGLGGAIFNGGTLTLESDTLTGNSAVGGKGGDGVAGGYGGGGGGLSGDGQTGTFNGGQGGAGGANGGGTGGFVTLATAGGFGGGGGGGGYSDFDGVDRGVGATPGADGGFGGGGGGGAGAGATLGGGTAFGGGAGGQGGYNGGGAGGGGGAGLGGAIFNDGGSVSVTNATFTADAAQGGAGGSALNPSSGSHNGAAGFGYGGAIFSRNNSLTITNATISGNTAADGGRGIYVLGDNDTATAVINNTIIGQSDTSVSDFVAATNGEASTKTSGVGDLIVTQSGFGGSIASTADPMLGSLLDNGGPTETMALGAFSPAFSAGDLLDAPTTDQRGAARLGWASIGAYQDSFVVVNTDDSGAGSLRQAILNANANPGTDTIHFDIPTEGEGVQTIAPATALPTITDSVIIDGYSQSGASANTVTTGENAVLQIELDGAGAGASANGLTIDASNCDVKGLAINRFSGSAVSIIGGSGNAITGDFLGTDAAGTSAEGNGVDGVRIQNGASRNSIGGTTAAARDVIAFNAKGVAVVGASSVGESIEGDLIFSNTDLGIDLGDDGVTPNGTSGPGPNDFQNHPVLTSVTGGQVAGTLHGAANATYRIEFFATPRTGGAFEGETFLGFADVTTSGSGFAAISASVTAPPSGWMVTATATNTANGDTSEFSAGPPASATVNDGSGQDATVGTAFGSPLAVLVKDAFGDAVQAVSVSFAGSDSGATATFPNGASAVTDATGVASLTADAGTVAGAYSASATVAGLTPLSFALTNDPGAAASLTVTGGSGQDAMVGTDFETALTVVVRDKYGNVVPGVVVNFTGPDSGASIAFPDGSSAESNASGVAEVFVAANTTAGVYTVTATAADGAGGASFTLTNDPGAAASLTVANGSDQNATVGTDFETPLTVVVHDKYGNVVPGVVVNFIGPVGGAGVTFPNGSSAETNAAGEADLTVAADTSAGAYTVAATIAGVKSAAPFALTNDSGTAASVNVVSGSGQDTTVGTAFESPLNVVVHDSFGNPVPGVTVSFAGPDGGAGATFPDGDSSVTDGSGAATVFVAADAKVGAYTVTASAAGAQQVAAFSLTNDPGAAASVTAVNGSGQDATVGTSFGAPLTVLVQDRYGNAVPGAVVNFVGGEGGAEATFPDGGSAVTGGDGEAQVTAAADGTAGAYTVSASVAGAQQIASFSLTNDPGAAASLTATGGSGQDATVGTDFETPLTVVVRDKYNNIVPGVVVNFAGPDGGAGVTFPDGSSTESNASGVAEVFVTANTTAGAYTVTATASDGAGGASFTLTNDPGVAASLTVANGSDQNATVGTNFETPLTVVVRDKYNNVVPGATVVFSGPASGAGVTFPEGASAVSDASGTAQVIVAANTTTGAYTVTASTSGVTNSAAFALNNESAAATTLTVLSGSGQDATVATQFKAPLAVFVHDAFGNPVPGVVVRFAGPSSGAGITFSGAASAVTDGDGIAQLLVAANTTAGAYSVTATADGVAGPASFALTNDPGAAAQIQLTGVPSTINEQDPISVGVHILDAFGNVATGFRGTIHFASDDPRAVLPSDYTFTEADAGVHGFLGLRLKTPGSDSLSVKSPGLVSPAPVAVDVHDFAPAVTLNTSLAIVAAGAPLQSSGQFTDADGSTWTATVDYGDGGPQTLALGANKTFTLDHTYLTEGQFTVTVVVTDESGVASPPATFPVEVFLAGTDTGNVKKTEVAPGSNDSATSNGVTGTLYRSADDGGDGGLFVTPLPPQPVGPTVGTSTAAASYDVRGVNLSADDKVVVTFTYPAGGVAPILFFFDRDTGTFRVVPTTPGPLPNTITATITRDSDPSVTELNGTVFTITVTPAADVIRTTGVAAAPPANNSQAAAGPTSIVQAVAGALSATVGVTTIGTAAGVDGGGGGDDDTSQSVQDILNDLPGVAPDKGDLGSPPSTAVLSPSQSGLPDKAPPDKKPAPKRPDPDKPKPHASGKENVPPGGAAVAPARPHVVQRTKVDETAPAGDRPSAPLAVDLVFAAGLFASLPNDRRRKRPYRPKA